MADNAQRYSLVRGRALRATLVDACGFPVYGARSQVTTKGIISVGFTGNSDTGTAISVQNANGDTCISDTPAPRFTSFTLEIAFCGVDPELYRLLTGQPILKNADNLITGFKVNSNIDFDSVAFALELWSAVPGEQCIGGAKSYGYFLAPFVQGGSLGDFTWQNDAINFTISGATTKDGTGWGVGPYDVMLDNTGTPGPLLEALDNYDHLVVDLTKVPPPDTSAAGSTAVGVAATGATAGEPGSFTPADSYPPDTLAGMSTVTASPNTAWATGEYVTIGDGSEAHWTGSAWAAGAA